jgi:hypothetical protein
MALRHRLTAVLPLSWDSGIGGRFGVAVLMFPVPRSPLVPSLDNQT